jgi:diketogulonate reductase-like aldo/keto reductase
MLSLPSALFLLCLFGVAIYRCSSQAIHSKIGTESGSDASSGSGNKDTQTGKGADSPSDNGNKLPKYAILEDDVAVHVPAVISLSRSVHLPRLGVGTAGLGARGSAVVYEALSAGVRLIDTAQATEWYSEEEIGRGINDFLRSSTNTSLDGIFVVTKVHPRSYAPFAITASIRRSQQLLTSGIGDGGKPLDLVLLHSPYCWPGHCTPAQEQLSWQDAWRRLETLKRGAQVQGREEKLLRSIGVSNFDEAQLRELLAMATTKVAAVQNWCDPFHQDRAVRRMAAEAGVPYMAYSSLGTQWQRWPNVVLSDPTLLEIARRRRASVAEVVLCWLLQEGVVAIPRSSDLEHLRENSLQRRRSAAQDQEADSGADAEAGYRCFLSPADLEKIRALDGTLGLPWDQEGQEEKKGEL